METNKQKNSLKVIVVGSSGVGKTSLINAFFDHPFESTLYSTVSPSYLLKTVSVDSKKVDLHIWDTAGQEQFQDIGRAFYHGSDVALVCIDYESKKSVNMWVERVRDQVPECYIFLAITKYDLISTMESEVMSEINQLANDIMKELKLTGFYMTSAKNNVGIEELFFEIAKCNATQNNNMSKELVDSSSKKANNKCDC